MPARSAAALALFLCLAAPRARGEGRYAATVRPEAPGDLPEERATSTVSRGEMDRRQPRSAPDALRYEAGVFVQQTAHGQGSAIVRGLTGEQTLLLFDGIRLNNSTYRQGPNQYFFTLDARTISAIEVLRGGGSTRYGSDALGGVIAAMPVEPFAVARGFVARPRLFARFTTADSEKGGRAELTLSGARGAVRARFLGGVGYRDVGLLESGGPVENPNPTTPLGRFPYVPLYARDGRTQLGTGFKELTVDGRLVLDIGERHRVTLAAYSYMQFDVPRTDQCPAPTAPTDTCLIYDQQFRHLAYGAWDGTLGGFARSARVTLSYQQQHEARRNENPGLRLRIHGEDDVHTVGLTARAKTDLFRPRPWLGLRLGYGLDTYVDQVSSSFKHYTDVADPRYAYSPERGQYLDGSRYLYGGAFFEGEATLGDKVTLRAGGRFSWIAASAPGDPESGSSPVDQRWLPVVGNGGVEWRPLRFLHFLGNVDHSFRAPNLNDLTARQQTGPGFQFENALLRPERATTFEAGVRVRSPFLTADLWAFETLLEDVVLKVSKSAAECPPRTLQCAGSWSRFELQNAPSLAELRGVEVTVRANLPAGLWLRATLAYAWGEGPRVGTVSQEAIGVILGERVPLSRVPPLNGTGEVGFASAFGLSMSAGLRWAGPQYRLAANDFSDGRIPKYGTPGFAVLDLRAAFRVDEHLTITAIFENVFDASYRYHGSSVDGPGRGFVLAARIL